MLTLRPLYIRLGDIPYGRQTSGAIRVRFGLGVLVRVMVRRVDVSPKYSVAQMYGHLVSETTCTMLVTDNSDNHQMFGPLISWVTDINHNSEATNHNPNPN